MAKTVERARLPDDVARQVARRVTRVVIVAARFNETVTRGLVDGATQTLAAHGIAPSRIAVHWVPGAFELPVAAAWAARGRPDAIIALGCLIRGETSQYAAIGQAVASALAQLSVERRVPVGFGVIIAESAEQAEARAGGNAGNRGAEAALAALEMVAVAQHVGTRPARSGRAGRR